MTLDRGRLMRLSLLYGLVMVYASTLIGPSGINFVYRDPAEAFRAFLETPYVPHGSDQRPDWIGNLLMLVPFGFLVTGAVWPTRPAFRLSAFTGASLLCLLTVLVIKYLQLFFPPRTVTLNYIMAQSLGSVIGCAGWVIWRARVVPTADGRDVTSGLVLALRLYSAALFLFVLMPLDFALDADDLMALLHRLPEALLRWPGAERPFAVRVVMMIVAAAAFAPVGALLSFSPTRPHRVSRGVGAVVARGLMLTALLFMISTLVISAYPAAISILFRMLGILLGWLGIRWLVRQDANALWAALRRVVPWAVPPYLLILLLINGLVASHWLSFQAAVAQAYPLGLLPLFDYYIVSKAEAAKNLMGHFALYLPVGVLLRLRYARLSDGAAFACGCVLSFGIELARYFRPGLEGDVNAVFVAGFAAMFAARMVPFVWSMSRSIGSHQDHAF